MATYKKGFKKQTSEQVILKVIVGIILSVIGIVGVAFIYDLATKVGDYTDYTVIDSYEQILTQLDENQDQIPDYLVYFYSESCTNCTSIKSDVLKLAKQIEKNGQVIFFVDTENMTDEDDFKVSFLVDIQLGLSQVPTPLIVAVADGVFYGTYTGTDDVLALLNEVESGDFTPFTN
ncbi:MAG: hypothetical protein KJ971_00950 [Firmicutes bacterium]|nr:hypothetical protein [Bacillota bacterium]